MSDCRDGCEVRRGGGQGGCHGEKDVGDWGRAVEVDEWSQSVGEVVDVGWQVG